MLSVVNQLYRLYLSQMLHQGMKELASFSLALVPAKKSTKISKYKDETKFITLYVPGKTVQPQRWRYHCLKLWSLSLFSLYTREIQNYKISIYPYGLSKFHCLILKDKTLGAESDSKIVTEIRWYQEHSARFTVGIITLNFMGPKMILLSFHRSRRSFHLLDT